MDRLPPFPRRIHAHSLDQQIIVAKGFAAFSQNHFLPMSRLTANFRLVYHSRRKKPLLFFTENLQRALQWSVARHLRAAI
jgi:hypothetical protein